MPVNVDDPDRILTPTTIYAPGSLVTPPGADERAPAVGSLATGHSPAMGLNLA